MFENFSYNCLSVVSIVIVQFSEGEMIGKSCSGNQNTHFVFSICFPKFYHFPDKVNIMYSTARQTTDNTIQHRENAIIQTGTYSSQG
jgi:hypothetical protein